MDLLKVTVKLAIWNLEGTWIINNVNVRKDILRSGSNVMSVIIIVNNAQMLLITVFYVMKEWICSIINVIVNYIIFNSKKYAIVISLS